MGTLEQIQQMKAQGIGDSDIYNELQQQGISPREIQDAMSQSQIKDAVASEDFSRDSNQEYNQNYAPQTQEVGGDYYSQDQGYGGGYSDGGDNTVEIAEQIFSEKIKKTEKKINEINEFKTLAQSKIDGFEQRLKRIENMIDQLQIKVLERVGNFGRDLEKNRKEIGMVQDSFGKMVNNIADSSSRTRLPKKIK